MVKLVSLKTAKIEIIYNGKFPKTFQKTFKKKPHIDIDRYKNNELKTSANWTL